MHLLRLRPLHIRHGKESNGERESINLYCRVSCDFFLRVLFPTIHDYVVDVIAICPEICALF